MKYLVWFSLLLSTLVLAKEDPNFESIKKKELADINEQLTNLNKFQKCVSSTKDQNGIRDCIKERSKETNRALEQKRLLQIEDNMKRLNEQKLLIQKKLKE